MRGGLFLMLKKNDLDRLESHWAVSAIPEKDRQLCFHTIDKIKTQKAMKNSIKFNFTIQKDWQDYLARIALAYEIPAIENISAFTKSPTTSSTGGLILALQRAMLLLAPQGDVASTFTGPL